ncbi:MAG: ATP-binding protein [Ktedonobacteraceae bacterium]
MSVEQTGLPPTDTNNPLGSEQTPPNSTKDGSTLKRFTQLWQASYHWFLTHTFTPSWLPKRWRHITFGYAIAILLQILAISLTVFLVKVFPSFAFTGLLEVLGIALIALNWGAGPSAVATIVGAGLLDFFILPPSLSRTLDSAKSIVEILLFLLVGFALTIVASRIERVRQDAETLSASLTTERVRLEAVIETVPGAVSIHDAQGTIIKLNSMGLQNAGADRSDATLATYQETFAVRTPAGATLSLEDFPVTRALHGEAVTDMKVRYLDAAGQDRFSSISAAPLHDAEGAIDGAVLVTHDITDLYLSEREAAAQAGELEAIFESITDGVVVFSSKQQISRMNSAFRELIGITSPIEAEQLFHPNDERRTQVTAHDENGQPLSYDQLPQSRILRGEVLKGANAAEVVFQTLDGHTKEVSVSGAPVRNQDGQLIGALCICRDVTERRQLERRTQETLRALLAMAEALVLTPEHTSLSGELTTQKLAWPNTASKVAHRMAELTCSVLGCQRVSITAVEPETEILYPIAVVGLPPEQERQWWAEQPQNARLHDGPDPTLTARLLANEVLLIDMTQPPFNAAPNPYNIHTLLIAPMSAGNQLIGFLSLDYGRTEHVYTEEEIALAKAVGQLAALVIERERLLRERADARASELALREANRRMDEFLGMTSHELKTPLTSIKGNTQLTVRQLRNSMQNMQKMQEMMESTDRQIRLLDRLVDDLLDISRTQSQQLQLSLAPCDLSTIVQDAVEEQQRVWPTRTIHLTLPAHRQTPINADASRISQVITNYLSNAHRYSFDDRPIDVTVQLLKEDQQVLVSVEDQGTGLSPEEQTYIWERFHRVHGSGSEVTASTQSAHAGLGLGLYICKTIIAQHGGSVGVESELGKGSTFWFTLPLLHEEIAKP